MPSNDHDIIIGGNRQLGALGGGQVPSLILDEGEKASKRYIEFLTANIRNRNTRLAYAGAINRFSDWCQERGIGLHQLSPFLVAAYIEEIGTRKSIPTVKQELAAIRTLGDWLVVGQILPINPAMSVRGPKYVINRGKTPVLTPDQARHLLDSIDTTSIGGLRDRALIATMVYSFARVSAVVGMNVDDYFADGKRWRIRLHEKGGRYHELPVHHVAEDYLDAYIAAAGIGSDRKSPLFRSLHNGQVTDRRMLRGNVWDMIKRRARTAGVSERIGCHTCRATGITAYMLNNGTLEGAQQIAAHSSPSTTKLYDRTNDEITLDEIERILI
jgi:site-specific recombinase XerD